MSTIHSTFDIPFNAGPYTVIGGKGSQGADHGGMSIVLVNVSQHKFRNELIGELCKIGSSRIICLESSPCPLDLGQTVHQWNILSIIVFTRASTLGARINTAIYEAQTPHVFILQHDMMLHASDISSRLLTRIHERQCLCTVPVFLDANGDIMPTILSPLVSSTGMLDVQCRSSDGHDVPTLAPWDYSGIYDREKFLSCGGYDPDIEEEWWQKLEFGLRARMWGEELRVHHSLKVSCDHQPGFDDWTPGSGYARFYMKTLGVRIRKDRAQLPRTSWWAYLRSSGERSGLTYGLWKNMRQWVHQHSSRYLYNARDIVDHWEWQE